MRNHPKFVTKIVLAFVALLLLAGAGGFAFSFANRSNPLRNLPEFPVEEYRQGDPMWRNSSYRLSGTLDNIILESKSRKNYLVSITPKGARAPLPVIVPSSASKTPLQRQQNLTLKVTVDSSGRIIASDCVIN